MLIRPRGDHRERGAGSVEYVALLLIVASALTLTVSVDRSQGGLVRLIQYGICQGMAKAFSGLGVDTAAECAAKYGKKGDGKDLPPCTVHQQDRLTGANATFRFIHAELSGKDQIKTVIDPATGEETTYVTLGGQAGAGVEADLAGAKDKLPDNKFLESFKGAGGDFGGKAGLEYGEGIIYKFDSREEAEAFLASRRGNVVKRAGGAVAGGRLDALYDLARRGYQKIRGQEESTPVPAGVELDLGESVSGDVSFGKDIPKTKGLAGAKLDGSIDAHARGKLRVNTDGTSQLEVRFDGAVKGGPAIGPGKDIAKKYPLAKELSAKANGTAGGATGYTVKFDENGQPAELIYQTETQYGGGYQVGNKSGKKGDAGRLTAHTYTLDLKDPENRAAFRDSTVKYGWSPALFAALPYLDTELAHRLAEDSVEYEQVYDTNGNSIAGGTPEKSKEKGVKERGFGLAVNDDESSRTLRSARYIDHGEPSATWRELAKCKAP